MKNKFLKSLMVLSLCGLLIVNITVLHAINLDESLTRLDNREGGGGGPITTDGGPGREVSGGGNNAVIGYKDFYEDCETTVVVPCTGSFTYYASCSWGFSYTLDVIGSKNNCQDTNDDRHICFPFSCRAN